MLPPLQLVPRRAARRIAKDTFVRTANTLGSGWGSAPIGGAWTFSAIGNTQLTGTTGLVVMQAGGTNKFATLNAVATKDFTIAMRFRGSVMPSTGTAAVQILGRYASTTSHFRGRLSISTAGVMTIRAFSLEGTSTEAAIGGAAYTSPLTYTPGTDYMLRYSVLGTTHKMRLWLASAVEPTVWHWTGTYTAGTVSAAGAIGLRFLTSTTGGTEPAHNFNVSLYHGYAQPGRIVLERPQVAAVVAGVTTLSSAIADTATYPNGSTIYCTGTFYEQIAAASFAASRSITIQALPPHSAVLTGSFATPITTGWTQLGGAGPVYTKTVAHVVFGLTVDGRPMLNYDTLARLQAATFNTGEAGPPEGFFSIAGTLYLRLSDSSSPDGKTVVYTRSGITDGPGGYGIVTPDNTTVTLIDMVLDHWPSRGISVGETGARVTGTRLWFRNVLTGVGDGGTPNLLTNHIRLEGCEYHMSGPVAAAAQQWNGPWNIRKTLGETAQGTANGGFDGVYHSNLSGRIIQVTCDDVQVSNCYIHDTFDCCEVKGRWETQDLPLAERISYIRGNTMTRFCDNGSEHDPVKKYTYLRVDHNFYMDGFGVFSTAPLKFGQVEIDHNIVWMSEDWYSDDGATIGKILKPVGNNSDPGVSDSGAMAPVLVHHNTFYVGHSAAQRWRIYETNSGGQTDFTYTGSLYRDNITIVYYSQKWELANWVLSPNNIIWPEIASANFVAADFKKSPAGTPNVFGGDTRDKRPVAGILSVNPLLTGGAAGKFLLSAGSPARSAASDGGDLGAAPFATGWTMAATGVGSVAALYRPALPISIAAAAAYWMGL
jgi:hypothetical protein